MLQLLLAVAFSAVPLTLYIPPVRSLNLFVESMEEIFRDTQFRSGRFIPRIRYACARLLDCILCSTNTR